MSRKQQIYRQEEKQSATKLKSKIFLAEILFEDDGGGDYGSEISTNLSGYYGGGGGGTNAFNKTFIQPFLDIFRTGQYAVERSGKAVQSFAAKVLYNFPRVFMPSRPLIFKELRDEEKAAYERMDGRYAEVLSRNNEALGNKDIKAMLFLLNPSAYLGAKLLQKSPKIAYETLNTLSGNTLKDLVTDIKIAYNKLPEVERRNMRVQKFIERYKQSDQQNKKTAAPSTVPDTAGSYGGYGGYDYSSEIYEAINVQAEALPQEKDFLEAALLYLDRNPEVKNQYFGAAIENIKQAGKVAIEELINKYQSVAKAKTIEEYSKLTGANVSVAKQELDKLLQTEISKRKDLDVAELEKTLAKLKQELTNKLLNVLKQDYLTNYKQTVLEPISSDPNVPQELKTLIQQI